LHIPFVNHREEADMTARIPNSASAWRNQVRNMVPPRDPNNGDDEDEEDEDVDEEEEEKEPAVIREPDEDE
jgi:hypothetical protein